MNYMDNKTISNGTALNIAKALIAIVVATLFVFFLVLRKSDPADLLIVFIMSIVAGSCSFFFVNAGMSLARTRQPKTYYALHLFMLLMCSLSGSILNGLFYWITEDEITASRIAPILIYTFVFTSIFYACLLYYLNSKNKLMASNKKIHEEKIRRLTLEKETALATLKILQAQIEPHFLFNTLSNVVSLFDIDIAKAKKMLMDLNEYLRTSLQTTRQDMISIDQELSLIRRYLDIFKVRLGNRLSYEIERVGDCSQISLPPMIIQPLVENAIKHGLEPKKEGGHIKVKCETDQKRLKITVSDSGINMGNVEYMMGFSLNNISKRLESIYGDQAILSLTDNKPSGLTAVIEVAL